MVVTAIILAGGRGSRMGGLDKGLVMYAGKRLVEHALENISSQTRSILINANRNHEAYQSLGYPVVSDLQDRFDGPLAGMQAGLHAANSEWLLCVPCDSPHLPMNLIERLKQAALAHQVKIAIAKSGGQVHPVICLLHTSLTQGLDTFLANGDRKVLLWQTQQPHVFVDFEDDSAFKNINRLDSL